MDHGYDARHRIFAQRLSYLRGRIANPDERRTEGMRLAALEDDVLAILEHLTGGYRECPEPTG